MEDSHSTDKWENRRYSKAKKTRSSTNSIRMALTMGKKGSPAMLGALGMLAKISYTCGQGNRLNVG